MSIMEFLKSVTKIVFLLVAISVCLGFFYGIINQDQFVGIASMVFAFYYKGQTTNEKEKQ